MSSFAVLKSKRNLAVFKSGCMCWPLFHVMDLDLHAIRTCPSDTSYNSLVIAAHTNSMLTKFAHLKIFDPK